MNDLSIPEFEAFLKNGVIAELAPGMTFLSAWTYLKSLKEDIDLWSRGDDWIVCGMISIGSNSSGEFDNRIVDRVGVNFTRSRPDDFFSSIPWISQLKELSRSELYEVLHGLGLRFYERIKRYDSRTSIRDEIQIGISPQVIFNFDDETDKIYQISWFMNYLDESDYPYVVELIQI